MIASVTIVPQVPLYMRLAVIPAELRELRQWVCWRSVPHPGQKKPKKIPIDPRTLNPASCNDSTTWGSFEDAVATAERCNWLSGVMFALTAEDEFCGIDIDNCINDGVLSGGALQVLSDFDSYTEFSPSGTGVKVLFKARKSTSRCRSTDFDGMKEIEVYDHSRFWTMTGARVLGTSINVEARQTQLDALCGLLWPEEPRFPRLARTAMCIPVNLDDQTLIDKAMGAMNGAKFRALWGGDTSAYEGDDSKADLALCSLLAFWTAGDADRIDRLFRLSGLMRGKWDERRSERTYGRMTIEKALSGKGEFYQPTRRSAAMHLPLNNNGDTQEKADDCPVILIDTDEHRVVEETVAALDADPELFVQNTTLVRVIRMGAEKSGVRRAPDAPVMHTLPEADLRARLTKCARFEKENRGKITAAHPPAWLVKAVRERGTWPGMRPIVGISDVPILRLDGTLFQTPGYDPVTCVLFMPSGAYEPIRERVTQEDVLTARDHLLELVIDFPFAAEEHRSAWLASLLTPLARHAFEGPSPLFLFDASTAGTGKTLLCRINGVIVLGRELPTCPYCHDAEEMRKRITSIAFAGDQIVMLDNVVERFGNSAIDSALTSTQWRDRVLGVNGMCRLPLFTTWFATGNNVLLAGDMARRVLHIRLESPDEQPEERSDFAHPRLIEYVRTHRARMVTAGLTILKGFLEADAPGDDLPSFGSFEGWSSVVRRAVIWAGMPDPCGSRRLLNDHVDASRSALGRVLAAWKDAIGVGEGRYLSDVIDMLTPQNGTSLESASMELRSAIVEFTDSQEPTARLLGTRLNTIRGRVVGGIRLSVESNTPKRHGNRWILEQI